MLDGRAASDSNPAAAEGSGIVRLPDRVVSVSLQSG